MQENCSRNRHEENPTFSALDEGDFQTVTIENELGCDMYLKKVEGDGDVVDQLHHGGSASIWIPPPRFSDRLKVADESREARSYVVIQIVEAKVGLFFSIIVIILLEVNTFSSWNKNEILVSAGFTNP